MKDDKRLENYKKYIEEIGEYKQIELGKLKELSKREQIQIICCLATRDKNRETREDVIKEINDGRLSLHNFRKERVKCFYCGTKYNIIKHKDVDYDFYTCELSKKRLGLCLKNK